ncbi:MAG TPA: hypothetical protein VGG10_22710 [Rhizomicrobium sp.]|jgi:hypothetical protein
MSRFQTALKLGSFLAIAGATLMAPTISSAQTTVEKTYVACNQNGECWRVHRIYAYGASEPIRYYNSDWYEAHQNDAHVRWLSDPSDDRGYYVADGSWHADPGARAVEGGVTGAGLGAAIGCLVTLPIGCAPGAAVGAAVGGGTGAVAGAASTPSN